jgi:hypothetical protein
MGAVVHSCLLKKSMEQYGGFLILWRIEQATFLCDPFNLCPSETPTTTQSKKQDKNTPLLLPNDDSTQ